MTRSWSDSDGAVVVAAALVEPAAANAAVTPAGRLELPHQSNGERDRSGSGDRGAHD